MAATGATPIVLYHSDTASNQPAAGNLQSGELAINTADGKLFYKDPSNNVKVIAANVAAIANGGTGLSSIGASGTVLTSDGSTASWQTPSSVITGLKETKVSISASNIDLSTGNYFTKTISTTTTFTVSNVPSTGTAISLILELTNGGSATINWWSGVTWVAATAPTLTASGRDSLGFYTYDGGTTWTGLVLGLNIS